MPDGKQSHGQKPRKVESASIRPPDDVSKLLASAQKIIEDVDRAELTKSHEERQYPKFDHSEVDIGAVLGVGGFGVVSEVSAIHVHNHDDNIQQRIEQQKQNDDMEEALREDNHYELDTAKQKMAHRCMRLGEARYAIKILDSQLNDLDRTRGMIDMALEVKYLKYLWHPNIGEWSPWNGIDSDSLRVEVFLIFSVYNDSFLY